MPDDEPGGLTVRFPVRVVPLYLAVMVTTVVADTVAVAIVKLAVKLFAGAVVDAGTLATAGLLLVSEIDRAAFRSAGAQDDGATRGIATDNSRRIDVSSSPGPPGAEPAVE